MRVMCVLEVPGEGKNNTRAPYDNWQGRYL